MTTTQRPPFTPRIIGLTNGTLVRVTRIDATDIGYEHVELIADSEPVAYRVTLAAQSAPPIAGFDPLTAEVWPTDSQITDAIENPPAPQKTQQQIWEEKLAGTITVTGPGGALQLKAAISACNRFSSMETLLKSGLERGAITDASNVSLWDASNQEHVMTVAQCRGVLFSYGYQWMAMFNEFAP